MYKNIAANKRRTIILVLAFVVFIGLIAGIFGFAYGDPGIVWFGLIFGLVYATVGYFASARIALALAGAKPVTKSQAPRLYRVVENLTIAAGLPMPQVYVIPDQALNAFATGRKPDKAAVAVTEGLLDTMTDNELEGVIAHELSHVGNYDIRLMAMVLVLVTIITVISNIFFRATLWGGDDDNNSNGLFVIIGLVLSLLAPIIATIMQLAVSRRREYLADASGALLTRYPEGLASALEKISQSDRPMRTASPATAHLFLANPLSGRKFSGVSKLFSTHPPIEDRIAKLRQMEAA